MSFKLKSPFKVVKKVDLEITHMGRDWKKFRTNVALNTPRKQIGKSNFEAFFDFKSMQNMEGYITSKNNINSDLYFGDSKISFNHKNSQKDSKTQVELKLKPGEEFSSELDWKYSDSNYRNSAEVELSATSSFDAMKSAK